MARIAWCLLLATVLCVPVGAQSADPFYGLWKLDLVASEFSTERPPKAEFLVIGPDKAGLSFRVTMVDYRGDLGGLRSVVPHDGSDGDVVAFFPADRREGMSGVRLYAAPWLDKMTFEWLGPRSARAVFRKGDHVRLTVDATVDATGRTMTWEQTGRDFDAREFGDRLVFRKP